MEWVSCQSRRNDHRAPPNRRKLLPMSVDVIKRFGLTETIITQTRAKYFSLGRDWRRRRHSISGGGRLKRGGPRQMGMGERGPGRRKANMNSKLLLRKRNGGLHFLAAEGRWATLILLFAINFSTTCFPHNLPPNRGELILTLQHCVPVHFMLLTRVVMRAKRPFLFPSPLLYTAAFAFFSHVTDVAEDADS